MIGAIAWLGVERDRHGLAWIKQAPLTFNVLRTNFL